MILRRSPPRSHISTIHFRKFNWLPVELRVELCTATTVFKYWNQLTSSYFNDIFTPSFNRYNSESQMALDIPLRKTKKVKKVYRSLDLKYGPKLTMI